MCLSACEPPVTLQKPHTFTDNLFLQAAFTEPLAYVLFFHGGV